MLERRWREATHILSVDIDLFPFLLAWLRRLRFIDTLYGISLSLLL